MASRRVTLLDENVLSLDISQRPQTFPERRHAHLEDLARRARGEKAYAVDLPRLLRRGGEGGG